MAAKGVPAKGPGTIVLGDVAGRAFARLQRGKSHEGLVGGAWWVGAAQGTVEQRFVERLVQRRPVFEVDAFNKQIRIEGGLAHQ